MMSTPKRRPFNERRAASIDRTVAPGPAKTARVDLGLALLSTVALPGVCYSRVEIAAWCGCTDAAIYNIEQVALKKIRNALLFRDPELRAAFAEHFFNRRQPARRITR